MLSDSGEGRLRSLRTRFEALQSALAPRTFGLGASWFSH